MAISKLGVSDKWVELASSSPTSGSTVTFSSLPEYRDYKLIVFDADLSGSANFQCRFNNDSGNNYAYALDAGSSVVSGSPASSIVFGDASANNFIELNILGANEPVKEINSWYASAFNDGIAKGFWNDSAIINRIDVVLSTGTFSSASLKVYGRNR
jgi:hypothetical protein